MPLLFGTAGIPHSAKGGKPEDGVRQIRALGLDCMELEFVYGVRMSKPHAAEVKKAATETGVRLTAHGPYYINLASLEEEKIVASRKRIMDTARIGSLCGAESITFHAAFFQGRDKREVMTKVASELKGILEALKQEDVKIDVRPELTGKPTQVGGLEELIELGMEAKGILPTIDFAHFYAREAGRYNSYQDFAGLLEQLAKNFGKAILKNMHIHISGIAYTPKGESKHLELEKSGFKWAECLKALFDYGVEGFCVCESPSLETDALLLKTTWQKLGKGKNQDD
jgi:deoxyribonuclease IV